MYTTSPSNTRLPKQWTQEKGSTNRQTMDTRKGKDKQTNNGHKKGEGQTTQ